MKRIALFITAIFICGVSIAQTIRWHIGDTVYQTTTCNAGESITPPTAPEKFGYSFVKWKLPYTRIEYLESTGTQWIDTGYNAVSENVKYKWKAIDLETGSGSSLFGAQANNGCSCLLYGGKNGRGWYAGLSAGSSAYISNTGDAVSWELSCNRGHGILKKGENAINSFSYAGSIAVDTVYIFASHKNGGVGENVHMKLYYLQIYDNDTLVRDFIPVLDLDGVPCMLDRVEGKFYYNAGTGQFIAGPIIGE